MEALMKSVRVRARVMAVFNKRRSDFETLAEHNDYLERAEDLIYNLTEGIDVNANERALNEYKREHASEIAYVNARAREEGREVSGNDVEATRAGANANPAPIPTSALRRGLENTTLKAYDENTEEGRRAMAEIIGRACGFDARATAKARCVEEAFKTIWV